MKKLAGLCGLVLLLIMPTMAQDTPSKQQDTPKNTPSWEFSGGYTYRPYYTSTGAKLPMSGWFGSVDYNWKSLIGVEGEILGVYKNAGAGENVDIYTFMIGPRIYPLRHRTLAPYAHLLYGGGRYSLSIPAIGGFPSSVTNNTAQAWEVGGGLDTNLWKHLGIVLQVDYGKTSFFSGNTNQGSTRLSGGIVYHLGAK